MKIIIITLIILIAGLVIYSIYPKNEVIAKSVSIDKMILEKEKRELSIYSNEKLIKTYQVSLGRNPIGPKEKEGDKKTPEGNYIISSTSTTNGYHKYLRISYPNKQDKLDGKKGSLIEIHGMKNGWGWIGKFHLLIDWTAGCIAVTDKEIDELYEIVKKGTPIEILP